MIQSKTKGTIKIQVKPETNQGMIKIQQDKPFGDVAADHRFHGYHLISKQIET